MNSTSPVVTGGVTVTAATLVPLVQWAMGGFPKPIPPDVPYLVAAGIVTGAHAAYALYKSRKGQSSPAPQS
jgi:hypothetical protein